MNKNKLVKRLLCFILLGVLLATLPVTYVSAKPAQIDFGVNIDAGYNKRLLVGYGAPLTLTVRNNNSSNFEGYIQVIVPNCGNNNVLYEEEITLGAGESKTVSMVIGIPAPIDNINVRMTNKKHKVVWKELQKVVVSKNKNIVNIGVLSDDFSALAYADRVHFLLDDSKTTSLIEMSAADFPTDYIALQMIDCILITDFSTDLLTKDQINALSLWLQKGGLLIIGTGSTSNKTLSGLKGRIINENVTSTTTRRTTLGLINKDYSYITSASNGIGKSYNYDGFYDNYYYYDFYSYSSDYYESDYDGDGRNDYIFNGYSGIDIGGDYYDAYNNYVDPSHRYLYEEDAFVSYTDGSIHYKYYDERYGEVIGYSDLDDLISQNYMSRTDIYYNAYPEYCRLYGYDPKWFLYDANKDVISTETELEALFEQYYGDDFEEFLFHYAYLYINYIFSGTDLRPDLSKAEETVVVSEYKPMDLDCCGLDENLYGISDSIIYGDDSLSSDFPLAKIIKSGEGYIALCAFDFTKNPIPRNDYSGEFFRNLVEETIGAKIINEANEYSNMVGNSYYYYSSGYNYSEEQLYKASASAPVPPFIFYIIVLGLYIISVLVLYVICSKKRKTWNLWVIYPCVALGVSVVIFCFGFSSRVLKLKANVISLIFPDEVITKEEDFISVVVPKSKEYELNFADDVEVDLVNNTRSNYSSYNSSKVDYDTYTVQYMNDYDHMKAVIKDKVALDSETFKTEAAYMTQGGLEVSLRSDMSIGGKGADNIKVVNNYSTTLEDVVVQVYDDIDGYSDYYFKKIKPGESIIASSGVKIEDNSNNNIYYYSTKYRNNLSEHYTTHKAGDIALGFMLGNLYGKFDKTLKRKAVFNYLQNEYPPSSDKVLVVGFPQSDIGAKVISGKKTRVNRTEAIIVTKSFSELPIAYGN